MFFTDTSREVYIPMAMNKGNVLYKDIFNVYTPFAYQINAFLIRLFGDSLRTFYFAGFFNSVLFIFGLFYTGCLLLPKEKFLSFLYCLFVTSSCIFAVSQGNYIFPYSYSVVYALTAVVWSLFFLLLYQSEKNNSHLYLSFFLFGLSISCKYEFLLFGLVLLFFFFDKKINFKTKIGSCVSFLLVPVFSFLLLLLQGCNFQIVKESFNLIVALANSEYVHKCYKFLGLIPSLVSLKVIGINFIKYLLCSVLFCFISGKLYKINKILTAIFLTGVILFLKPIFYDSNAYYFNWLGMLLIVYSVLFFIYMAKKYKNKTINTADKMFLILFLSVNLVSVKSVFAMNLNDYGTYFVPLALLCVWVSLCYYFPKIRFYIYSIFIILFFSYFLSNIERRNYSFASPVSSSKGTIFVEQSQANAINNLIKYINIYSKAQEKILVLPEGSMINYLTDKMSNDRYYYLIPPNIEIFGEEKIVKDLKENLPDYIILQSLFYNNFGEGYFCETFGLKICTLLPKFYDTPIIFGSDFKLALFKRKVKSEAK